MPKAPYESIDLPPRLTNTEWVWFFEHAAEEISDQIAHHIQALEAINAQIRVIGKPLPWKGMMTVDPMERRESLDRFIHSGLRMLAMAQYLLKQANQQEAEDFGAQIANYFANQEDK
jgi:hypothetical protein